MLIVRDHDGMAKTPSAFLTDQTTAAPRDHGQKSVGSLIEFS
jgi:hypothetical protein